MQLRYSPLSPFVRKVMVCAIERGLADRLEKIATNPWDPETDLGRENPLCKVPSLRLDDGTALFESALICEYLDAQGDGPRLFPPAGPERWRALRRHALADGILDAAVAAVVEMLRRPEGLRWTGWKERQMAAIDRAIDVLEGEVADFPSAPTIGEITAGIALGYLDFRHPDFDWRTGRPKLTAWYESFAARPAMVATRPPEA